MKRPLTATVPPLWIWGITFSLFSLIIVAFNWLNFLPYTELGSYLKFQARWNYFEENFTTHHDPEALTVFILGSSLTQDAIANHDYFAQIAEQQYGKKLEVYKLPYIGASLEKYLNQEQVFDFFIRTTPDIVAWEDNLIALESSVSIQRISFLAQAHKSMIGAIQRVAFWIPAPKIPTQFSFPPYEALPVVPLNTHGKRDTTLIETYSRINRSWDSNTSLNNYLIQLKKKGIKIVMLEYPRTQALNDLWDSNGIGQGIQEFISKYQQNIGMEYWEFNESIYYDAFSDLYHTNIKGREIFSKHLLQQIAKREWNY